MPEEARPASGRFPSGAAGDSGGSGSSDGVGSNVNVDFIPCAALDGIDSSSVAGDPFGGLGRLRWEIVEAKICLVADGVLSCTPNFNRNVVDISYRAELRPTCKTWQGRRTELLASVDKLGGPMEGFKGQNLAAHFGTRAIEVQFVGSSSDVHAGLQV